MSDLFQMIIESPVRALAFVLMLACVALLEIIRRSFFKRIEDNEKKLETFERSIGSHFKQTRVALASHSDDLGKATKAVNGDMLQIQKEVFTLKSDLLQRTVELETYARQLEHRTAGLAQVFQGTVDNFDLKLAHIVNLRKELESLHGKVLHIEENSGQFRITIGKLSEQMSAVAIGLKSHAAKIKSLEPKDKK